MQLFLTSGTGIGSSVLYVEIENRFGYYAKLNYFCEGAVSLRIVGSIEARMGSNRLPGKTLVSLYNGMPLLECVVRRFRACRTLDEIVVATTVERGDDSIADWCAKNGVSVFRGSEEDVLGRVAGAALQYGADVIVQMGADSAYLDYQLIDQMVVHYRGGQFDYVCNDLMLTYPLGIYGHVVSASKLVELNNKQDLSLCDREDVVRYIWEHPDTYRIFNITAPPEFAFPQLRFTVDYPEDMQLAIEIYSHFNRFDFTTRDLIELYKKKPEMFGKTKNLVQKSAPFIKGQSDG